MAMNSLPSGGMMRLNACGMITKRMAWKPVEAERSGSFHLSFVDALNTGAEDFCNVGTTVNRAGADGCHERIDSVSDNLRKSKVNQENLNQQRRASDTVYVDRSESSYESVVRKFGDADKHTD